MPETPPKASTRLHLAPFPQAQCGADLQVEVQRIIAEQKASGADRNNLLIRFGVPHFDQTPDHLKPFIAYALWGVDKKGNCLTHRRADHFETVEKINEKYGSETAIAAAQRHKD